MRLLDQLKAPEAPKRETLLARLGLTDRAVDPRQQIYDKGKFGREAVQDSEDLERILALPRRPRPTDAEQQRMAEEMTARLRRDNPSCRCAELRPRPPDAPPDWSPCITQLLPIQGWYLYEAAEVGGALGHIVVGGGKTGIDILLAMVIPNARRAVLLIPPNLRKQFAIDFVVWSQHFKTPNLAGTNGPTYGDRPTLYVLAYSELSSPGFATWLKAYNPDLVIDDEAHNLGDKTSVRTDRYLRFYVDKEEEGAPCRGCSGKGCPSCEGTGKIPAPPIPTFAHSGSLTSDSLDEYGHLSALCLREGSPLPLETATLGQWCEGIDPTSNGPPKRAIGALKKLCANGETAREGFARRLVETRGVITTEDATLPSKLRILKREVGKLPPIIASALAYTREERQRLDGETLTELTEVAAVCRQMSCGFFYRWKYPRCPTCGLQPMPPAPAPCPQCKQHPEPVIDKWFSTRQAWFRELRERLEHRSDLMDSPMLCREAAERFYAGDKSGLPLWPAQNWPAWAEIADSVYHEKETVWVDDFLARDAVKFGQEAVGVIWVQHHAFGLKVSELGNFPLYGSGGAEPLRLQPTAAMLARRASLISMGAWDGGDVADNWIKTEDGSRTIICSIKAHGTGKNLQVFKRCLVANPPVKGWEQLLGRLHRHGQMAAMVDVHVYRHTAEVRDALDKAVELASYVQQTTRKAEKLCYAEFKL